MGTEFSVASSNMAVVGEQKIVADVQFLASRFKVKSAFHCLLYVGGRGRGVVTTSHVYRDNYL